MTLGLTAFLRRYKNTRVDIIFLVISKYENAPVRNLALKSLNFIFRKNFYLRLRIKPSHRPTRPRPGVVTIFQRVKFVSTRGRVISYISAL